MKVRITKRANQVCSVNNAVLGSLTMLGQVRTVPNVRRCTRRVMNIKYVLVFFISLVTVIVQTGCVVGAVGAGAAAGMYIKGALKVDSKKSFELVFKAVEQTCQEMKFTISRKEQKEFKGTIVAEGDFGRVTFEIKARSPEYTDVSIRVGAFGDKGASELIYNRLKPKL